MADKREQILTRLETVCAVSGLTVYRNKDELSERQKPCIVIWDADEQADERDPRTRPASAPRRVTMAPEIWIHLQALPENVGSELNAIRAELLAAVLSDATLQGYTVNDDGIRYDGCSASLGRGRAVEASLGIAISFTYVLRVEDLTST